MNESMSDEAVCRTAPTTPGLSKIMDISINFINQIYMILGQRWKNIQASKQFL